KNISASHIYGALGTFNATLSVKDDNGAVATETFAVVVTKRATSLIYDGETAGRYGGATKLSATLTDKLGGVANKNVTFQLGAQTATALTDINGKAKAEITIDKILANYPIKATFLGDGKYLGSEVQAQLTATSPKRIKQEALTKLKTLAGLLRQKDIQKAAADMEDALASKLWTDDFHLDAKHGQKVFDSEKEAIKDIQRFIKDRRMPISATVKADLKSVIDSITFSDDALVDIALSQTKILKVKNPKYSKKRDEEIKKAEAELADALREVSKGNEDKAVDDFGKAWNSVQLAIEFALK
ncbi:MAG TPA: Ig-like domain repeat protein, partial [Methylococcales bacterium]